MAVRAEAPAGAAACAAAVRERRIGARELAQVTLDRIRARDGELQAFTWIDEADFLAQADAVDAGRVSGPLAGVPVAVKDLIDVRGMPTSYGSAAFDPYRAERDAAVVARLRAAGAVIAGKTRTAELAWSTTTPLDAQPARRSAGPGRLERRLGGGGRRRPRARGARHRHRRLRADPRGAVRDRWPAADLRAGRAQRRAARQLVVRRRRPAGRLGRRPAPPPGGHDRAGSRRPRVCRGRSAGAGTRAAGRRAARWTSRASASASSTIRWPRCSTSAAAWRSTRRSSARAMPGRTS